MIETYEGILKRVSAKIQALRLARDLSQEQAAEDMEMNYRFYQKVESGRHSFNLQTLYRVAAFYRCTLYDLFSGTDRSETVRLKVEKAPPRPQRHRAKASVAKRVAARKKAYSDR